MELAGVVSRGKSEVVASVVLVWKINVSFSFD